MNNSTNFKIIFLAAIGLILIPGLTIAQLSPPGLGKAKTASWFAFGLKQTLDSAKKKESMTYIGIGRKSNPEGNANPFHKQAIIVFNQEFYNNYVENWQYSYAISYRNQNNYEDSPPYNASDPSHEQEFRIYGRYSYITGNNRLKWKNTFRQEFRKFFTPQFTKAEENFQLRTRLKTQLSVSLGESKIHQIIGSAEALFAVSKDNFPEKKWTRFAYKESRLGAYYSISPSGIPFTFDIGYMNNILRKNSNVSYISIDVVWENPFGDKKNKK